MSSNQVLESWKPDPGNTQAELPGFDCGFAAALRFESFATEPHHMFSKLRDRQNPTDYIVICLVWKFCQSLAA